MDKNKNIIISFAMKILKRVSSGKEYESFLGDVEEYYKELITDKGIHSARLWYLVQIVKSIGTNLVIVFYWRFAMLRNYLKIAYRNMKRNKGYSFINIFGLSTGIACSLLIMLFVADEFSFDRFYEDSEQIYRVCVDRQYPNRQVNFAASPAPMAQALMNDLPDIINAVRLFSPNATQNRTWQVRYNEKVFEESSVLYVDSTFFSVFSIPLLHGEPNSALKGKNSLVITRSTALKYFGEENPIGKSLSFDNQLDLIITGITEDLTYNSHFKFDFLIPISNTRLYNSQFWLSYPACTYLLLRKDQSIEELESKFPAFVEKYMAPQVEQYVGSSFSEYQNSGNGYRFFLQPITEIHLHSNYRYELEPNSSITYVYFFSGIALVVLLIACINFMNLSTARSASRAKEIGLRKVLGSYRRRLVLQFLVESEVYSFLSLLTAIGIVFLCLPEFRNLVGRSLDLYNYNLSFVIGGLVSFAAVIGLLAGLYPSLFLSSFRPIAVLKGKLRTGAGSGEFRNGLVIFQFSISICLIIGALLINKQLNYMINANMGFDKNHLVVIDNASVLGQRGTVFKDLLLNNVGISGVSFANTVPGRTFRTATINTENSPGEGYSMYMLTADYDYIETLGMEIIKGRNFSRDFRTDSSAVLINEQAANELGWDDPIGKEFNNPSINANNKLRIIGLVKNFNYKSLQEEISPLLVQLSNFNDLAIIRIETENIQSTLAYIEKTWNEITTNYIFKYSFLDRDFERLYVSEQNTKVIFGSFSGIAIVIACLGLFSLAAFLAEKKTKEIALRKVLGASYISIIFMISKDFLKGVAVANLIAWPTAYIFMYQWLQNFAYRIDISLITILLSGMLTLVIAILTVSFQAFKAAKANPVDSLRFD